MEQIISLIQQVGFPIAAAIAMYIQNVRQSKMLATLEATIKSNTEMLESISRKLDSK